jgi:hypothetical protein
MGLSPVNKTQFCFALLPILKFKSKNQSIRIPFNIPLHCLPDNTHILITDYSSLIPNKKTPSQQERS